MADERERCSDCWVRPPLAAAGNPVVGICRESRVRRAGHYSRNDDAPSSARALARGATLSKGFDLGMFVELIRLPDVRLMSNYTSSYVFAFVFFVFMLFVSGGILETYHLDRKLTTDEFFAASGAFFWQIRAAHAACR